MATLTTKEFIERCRQHHGDYYDYSKVVYTHNNEKVEIICPRHGAFEQVARNHGSGRGCHQCALEKIGKAHKKTTREFVRDARKVHGDAYDYSNTVYRGVLKRLNVVCARHGLFTLTARRHLEGSGCPGCGFGRPSGEELKRLFIKRHGNRYDYSLVDFVNVKPLSEKIDIICPVHGVFSQSAQAHKKLGCDECGKIKHRCKTEDIVKQFIETHGDRYDYSTVEYVNAKTPVAITCKEHGVFMQLVSCHRKGKGCGKCGNCWKKTKEEFVEDAIAVHGDRYDYSLSKYVKNDVKLKIICPNHGVFKQTPNSHVSAKNGCPKCAATKGEVAVEKALNDLGLDYVVQYSFNDCLTAKGKKSRFDFAVFTGSSLFCLIEYDGLQHFRSVKRFGGKETFDYVRECDRLKNEYCDLNNLKLFRISYRDLDKISADYLRDLIF
jgi:hypothetical protein